MFSQIYYYIISVRFHSSKAIRIPIISWFRRRNFNIVGFLEFKNAYSYTVGVEFYFFIAQSM